MEASNRVTKSQSKNIVIGLRRGKFLFSRVTRFDNNQGEMESIDESDWKMQDNLEQRHAQSLAEALEQLCRVSKQNEVHAKVGQMRMVTQRWGDLLVTVMFYANAPVSKSLRRILRSVAKKHSKGVKSPGAYAPTTAAPEISRPSGLCAGNP